MDLFLPLPFGADAVNRRGDENYNVMARLKPGVTMEQAQADVSMIAGRIRDKDKRDKTFTISVVPLLDQVVGNVRRALLVLLGSVALVLLIACANVANLLLTRATGTAEGSGDSHGARRQVATPRPAAADRERPSWTHGRRRRPADCAGRPVRRAHRQPGKHPAARRHHHRSMGARLHVRRIRRDGHRLRPGAGAPRARRSTSTPASRPVAATRRAKAGLVRRGGACAACSSFLKWRSR